MLETVLQIVAIIVFAAFFFGVVVPPIKRALDKLPNIIIDRSDPVTHCQCYVEQGCSHVDGMHCEMRSCSILKDYRKDNV